MVVRSYEKYDFYHREESSNQVKQIFNNNHNGLIQLRLRNPIKLTELRSVLKETSINKKLSIEYSFLKDAEEALSKNDSRKAILDAATSLEIALNNYLEKNLKVPDKRLKTEILKLNNSLSKKRQLTTFTSLNLPNLNYQKEVEEFRNRAIHAGKKPNEDEARSVIKIVKESLNFLVKSKFELS